MVNLQRFASQQAEIELLKKDKDTKERAIQQLSVIVLVKTLAILLLKWFKSLT